MTRSICRWFVAFAALFASPALAQTEAESIRARVKDGQRVSVTADSGREMTGRIRTRAADGLNMIVDGRNIDVPYDRIVRLDRPHDSLGNGALIGLGAGAAFGLIAVASGDECRGSEFFCGDPSAGNYAAAALLFGGLGTAVGVGIDALIHRDREIYRRGAGLRTTVAPGVGHATRSVVVSMTW